MSVKIITGNGATVSAEDDRALHMATITSNNVIFANVGEEMKAEIIDNNTIRIHSGEGMMQGIHFRIPYNDFCDITIDNGTQGYYRYDVIAMKYEKNVETNEETITPVVLKGTPSNDYFSPYPNIPGGSIYEGDTEAYFPLYIVRINELSIGYCVTHTGSWKTMSSQSDLLSLAYPVGSIYISVSNASPQTLFGIGTWERFAKGRTLVGVDESDSDFKTVKKEVGEKTHTLTESEMPAHSHSPVTGTEYGFNHYQAGKNVSRARVATSTKNTDRFTILGNNSDNTLDESGLGFSRTTNEAGGGEAHNNIQPSITVYMWVRTA